jgi:DNA-binding CsgD family transcriptional regulator
MRSFRSSGSRTSRGSRAIVRELVEVSNVSDPLDALGEAIEAGLVWTEGTGPTEAVEFVHPLIRAAVYHDQAPAHRADLHRRAAHSSMDDAVALRHREAAAAAPDRELADAFAQFAARRFAVGDWSAAARAYTSAGRLHPDRATRERHIVEAAACHVGGGESAEALALSDEAGSFGDPAARAYMASYPMVTAGRAEDAIELLAQAWDACDPEGDPRLACYIAIRASTNIAMHRPLGDVELWARRAIDLDRSGGMAGNAMFTLATGLGRVGRLAEGLAVIDRLREREGVSEIARGRWLLPRGILKLWSDDLDGAVEDLSGAADVLRRHGPTLSWLVCLNPLADAEFRLGRWDDAIAHAELGVSAVADLDFFWMSPYNSAIAVMPLASRGDWEEADGHLQQAKKMLELFRGDLSVAWAAHAGAHLAAARGDHARVLAELAPLLDLDDGRGWDDPAIQPWRDLEAEALVALGRLDEAGVAVERLEQLGRERGVGSTVATAARVRGRLEAARGDADSAVAAFAAAVDAAPANQPFRRGLVHVAFGSLLRRTGQRRLARSHLSLAHQLFRSVRPSPYVERTERELAATGLSPSRRDVKAPSKLTPQESAVVHLARKSFTNKEIASELVISVRTVEYHLTNAYQKLGVSSRRELIKSRAEAP